MKKIFVVAALIVGSQTFAQDTAQQTLNEVIVTANKVEQKQSATGKVVTVITSEQLQRQAGRTVAQVLNEQAGITINGAYNNIGSNQSVFMRGAAAGRTLILLDGVPVYDPSLISNEFDINLLAINDIERIEVCRGAQSTLYGSDAIAGVINIITVKKDVTKAFNAKATLSAGNFDTYRGNAQVYGKVGKLTYTTRYAHLRTSGFSAAHDSTGTRNFDNDGYKGHTAGATLQYQLTPELLFKTFAQYNGYNTEADAARFTDEKDFSFKTKNVIAGTGFRYSKGAVNITGNYQYSDVKRNYFNDSIDKPGFARFAMDDYFGKNNFVELFASVALSSHFTLLQGADYRFSSMNSRNFSLSSFGPYNAQFKDTSMSQSSLYASLLFNGLAQKLNIELGGRLNVHSRYGSNYTVTFNPSYNINKHLRVFGSIATGFKAPSIYQLYSPFGERNLKPEESITYEGGLQQQHTKVQNRIVVFKRDITNGLDFNYINFRYFNFLKQDVTGIEWEGTAQPFEGLNISANYTYLRGEEKTQSRVTFKDTTYSYLLRRPHHNLNVTTAYSFANGLTLSVMGKYVSRRNDVGNYKRPDVALGDYFILNAYAAYRFKKHFRLFADAQNITGRKFFDVWGYNAIPFIVNGGITVNL